MKKWMFLFALCLLSCTTQKHIQTERITTKHQAIDINKKLNKNTTKFIVITKYQNKKDTTTGEYPVESVTEIKEVNNDEVVTKAEAKAEETINEQTEEVKRESSLKWYIVCFFAGVLVTLIILALIKLLILYLKRGV